MADWINLLLPMALSVMASLAGTLIGIIVTTKLITYRLSALEDHVKAHNNHDNRLYDCERSDAVMAEKIKVINNRLKDLEGEKL